MKVNHLCRVFERDRCGGDQRFGVGDCRLGGVGDCRLGGALDRDELLDR